jgi:hypothetical protein
MPSQTTLSRFVSLVEQGEFLRAIEEFYAPNASMQENDLPPRVGKAALLANERKVLEGTQAVTSTCVGPVFVSGDLVVIRWLFHFEGTTGKVARIEELAYQRWQGEQIVEEQFFYDPAQMRAST